MGDSVRSEGYINEFWEGFAEGIKDKSKELKESGAFQKAVDQIEREIMWGKGRNYPKLDTEAMYKTPGR